MRSVPAADPPRLGWVLGGGGARGAYEVGVCDYIFDRVARDLGGPVPLLHIQSSEDIGKLSAAYVPSRSFRGWRHGFVERVLARLAERESAHGAALL